MEPLFTFHGMTGLTLFSRTDGVLGCDDDLGGGQCCDEDDTSIGFECEVIGTGCVFLNRGPLYDWAC